MLMCSNIHLLGSPLNATAQWREDWPSASVVNYTNVTNCTIWQPGFDLPRQSWSLLNRFRAGQGPCHAFLHKWGLAKSPTCGCGQQQTMSHIADSDMCPLMEDYNCFRKLKMMQSSGWNLQRLQHSQNEMNYRQLAYTPWLRNELCLCSWASVLIVGCHSHPKRTVFIVVYMWAIIINCNVMNGYVHCAETV